MSTQTTNNCTCPTEGDTLHKGNITVAPDASGEGGNIEATGTISAKRIQAENLTFAEGQATVSTGTIVGDGVTSVFPISHAESTQAVAVAVYESGEQVGVGVSVTSDTVVSVTFDSPPPTGKRFDVVVVQYMAPTIEEEEGGA